MKLLTISVALTVFITSTNANQVFRVYDDGPQRLGNIYYALGECAYQKDTYSAFKGCLLATLADWRAE